MARNETAKATIYLDGKQAEAAIGALKKFQSLFFWKWCLKSGTVVNNVIAAMLFQSLFFWK